MNENNGINIDLSQINILKLIENAVEKRVNQEIDEMHQDIPSIIDREIKKAIYNFVKDDRIIFPELIKDRIALILAQECETKTGWGESNKFKSFDEFLISEIKLYMSDKWRINEALNNETKNYVRKMWETKQKEYMDLISTELTAALKKHFECNL